MSRRTITAGLAGMLLAASLIGAPATAATTWASPASNLSADLSSTTGFALYPDIALSTDGTRATAVWTFSSPSGAKYVIQTASAEIVGNVATWSAVQTLSEGSQDANLPQVALSADGTKATAVWERNDGSHQRIQTASAEIVANTMTWSAVQTLSVAGQNAYRPQIALSATGTRATAAWHRSNGVNDVAQTGSAEIEGRTALWSAVQDLSPAGNAYEPDVAISTDGTRATVVWYIYLPTYPYNAVIQTRSATIDGRTATWSASVQDLSVGGNSFVPQVALSDDGTRATAVWYRSFDGDEIIQTRSATIEGATATWSTAQDLSSVNGNAAGPQVSVSADGTRATAVWSRRADGVGTNDVIQTKSAIIGASATWSTLATDLSPAGNAYYPQIELSADGTSAVTVWEIYLPSPATNVVIQSRSAAISGLTSTWSSILNLSAGGESSYWSGVTMSNDGTKATAVWFRGLPYRIQSASATVTGGAEPHALGYWKRAALAELLPQPLGAYEVETQTQARAVLKATNCGIKPSAVAGCLAGQLLVAELNVEAGVDDSCIEADITDANEFLDDDVDYDGPGTYSLSKTQRRDALALIMSLVAFNSDGCP